MIPLSQEAVLQGISPEGSSSLNMRPMASGNPHVIVVWGNI